MVCIKPLDTISGSTVRPADGELEGAPPIWPPIEEDGTDADRLLGFGATVSLGADREPGREDREGSDCDGAEGVTLFPELKSATDDALNELREQPTRKRFTVEIIIAVLRIEIIVPP